MGHRKAMDQIIELFYPAPETVTISNKDLGEHQSELLSWQKRNSRVSTQGVRQTISIGLAKLIF